MHQVCATWRPAVTLISSANTERVESRTSAPATIQTTLRPGIARSRSVMRGVYHRSSAGWDLPGNNRIGWSEADNFHRHGGRRPAIHDLQCWFNKVVDGRPAPAMTVTGVQVGIGALISE